LPSLAAGLSHPANENTIAGATANIPAIFLNFVIYAPSLRIKILLSALFHLVPCSSSSICPFQAGKIVKLSPK
jgi:hypothetical protein